MPAPSGDDFLPLSKTTFPQMFPGKQVGPMPKPSNRKRICWYIGLGLVGLVCVPFGLWASLTHRPKFYRPDVGESKEVLEEEAKHFVKQSLQLRNDIANEPTWEAVFSDREVNAWLAEDLITHFADQLPPEIHDPRIMFETDRMTLAFGLDQGPVRSVIWVVARPRVPEDNVISLTLEKIRAGALPVPPDRIIKTLSDQAKRSGLDITWSKDGDLPVATIRYRADRTRNNVVLERVHIRGGQIKLSGRSNRAIAKAPTLPRAEMLQLNFPRRKVQDGPEPPPAAEAAPAPAEPEAPAARQNSADPVS
jgi:hypothetical protein